MKDAEAVFIAVGTPARRGDGHADLTFVFDAVRELARVIRPGTVVVTKSTVPVGTGDRIEEILREEGVTDVSVASNPEFLREGAAIADFKHPDRIVVGAEDERAQEVLKEIYRPLFLNRAPILFTGRRTAELTKYAANAFLAVKISFINEIADLCEAVDADVQDVARGIGLDNRIGPKFLHAGPGYGGSCFPKDTLALLQTADKFAASTSGSFARRSRSTTTARPAWSNGVAGAGRRFRGKRVGVLGLAFKPNTDDMREAPSIPIDQGAGRARRQRSAHSIRLPANRRKRSSRGIEFASRCLCRSRWRGRPGDRHRMGRVPGARPRQASPDVDLRGKSARRPANVYDRDRGGGSGIALTSRWPRRSREVTTRDAEAHEKRHSTSSTSNVSRRGSTS